MSADAWRRPRGLVQNLFGIRFPHRPRGDKPLEAYVRETDLVARYAPRSTDCVSHEVYYRAPRESWGLDLILSVQTDRLDSLPAAEVTCIGSAATQLSVGSAGGGRDHPVGEAMANGQTKADTPIFLLRPSGLSQSIACWGHPADIYGVTTEDEPASVTFQVFPNSLEKGVIRRAVFHMRVVPRDQDVKHAAAVFSTEQSASPPLTA